MFADIVVFAVLVISAAISFMRGFIRETLTILGVVGGMGSAYFGGPVLNPFMRGWLGVVEGEDPKRLFDIIPYTLVADLASYGVIFITVVIVLSLISHALAETVRSVGLGSLDRTLGVFFGLARGVLLLGLLYLPFHLLFSDEQKEQYFADSKTIFYLEQTSAAISSLLPDSTREQLKSETENAQQNGQNVQDTLKQIDLLKQLQGGQGDQNKNGNAPADPNAPGYDKQFRSQMNQMFEQQQNPPPLNGNDNKKMNE